MLPGDLRDSLLDMQYRGQSQQIAADHPAATREILVADGTDAGLLILDRDARSVHVVDIVIASAQRRRGIASSALRATIAEAGDRVVTLSVWSGNSIARSLYERLGFVVVITADTPSEAPEGYLSMERRPGR